MIIYKTTNLITGKIYIGKDSKNNPNYLGSGVILERSIKKYGKEYFIKEILEYCTTINDLNDCEIKWISIYNSTDKEIGYNISFGGNGGYDSYYKSFVGNKHDLMLLMHKKRSDAVKKAWANLTDEQRRYRSEIMSGENNPMYGKDGYWKNKTLPKNTIQKIKNTKKSQDITGENNPNYNNRWGDEQKEIQSNLIKSKFKNGEIVKYKEGKTHIEIFGEEKAKEISDKMSKKASLKTGNKNPFYGKTHTNETKEKIRQSKIGKKPPNMRKIIINNNVYESLNDAHRTLDIKVTTIWHRLKSKNYPNYNYINE